LKDGSQHRIGAGTAAGFQIVDGQALAATLFRSGQNSIKLGSCVHVHKNAATKRQRCLAFGSHMIEKKQPVIRLLKAGLKTHDFDIRIAQEIIPRVPDFGALGALFEGWRVHFDSS
jgi:hypothetical protein